MKIKIFAIILCLLSLSLFTVCCGKEETETTEAATWAPLPTEPSYTLSQMSPPVFDISAGFEFSKNLKDLDTESFEEISSEKSFMKNSGAEKILKNGRTELYYMKDSAKVFMIIADEKDIPVYSASYVKDTGDIEFIGDDTRSWYFDSKGNMYTMVYTFFMGDAYEPIYTYYTPDGKRDFVIAAGNYYNGSLDLLSNEDSTPYVTKYSKTSELFHK